MTVGEFLDTHQNIVSVSHSSDVKGGLWLRIKATDRPGAMTDNKAASHLSVDDARVLITLLEKGIAALTEEESDEQ